MSEDWRTRLETTKLEFEQRQQAQEHTKSECAFIRAHHQIDMSASQLARYYGITEPDFEAICKQLKLKIGRNQLRMTAFCTPYPPQIAKSVKKFSWANYHGDNHGQGKIYPADSD